MNKLSLVAASGLTVAALTLAGCSSAGSTGTVAAPPASTSASAAPSTSAGGGAAAVGSTVDGKELATTMKAAMEKAKTGKAVMAVSGQASTTANMDFDYSDPAKQLAHMTMKVESLDIESVVDGQTVYMKGFPSALTGGKEWIKFDPNGTDAFSKAMKQGMGDATDPNAAINAMNGATVKVKSSTADSTTYELTGITGDSGATMQMTVGSDGLPQKSVVDAAGATVTLTYSDWGTPVAITVPDASQVGTLNLPKS